jgi:hypothetical protein
MRTVVRPIEGERTDRRLRGIPPLSQPVVQHRKGEMVKLRPRTTMTDRVIRCCGGRRPLVLGDCNAATGDHREGLREIGYPGCTGPYQCQ